MTVSPKYREQILEFLDVIKENPDHIWEPEDVLTNMPERVLKALWEQINDIHMCYLLKVCLTRTEDFQQAFENTRYHFVTSIARDLQGYETFRADFLRDVLDRLKD